MGGVEQNGAGRGMGGLGPGRGLIWQQQQPQNPNPLPDPIPIPGTVPFILLAQVRVDPLGQQRLTPE